MKTTIKLKDKVDVKIERRPKPEQKIQLEGHFTVEHFREGKKIGEYHLQNGITDIGQNTLLDIMFETTAKISNWYIGLIQDGGYTGLSDSDTMSSHSGWTEFTGYDESNRVLWDTDAATGGAISNSTTVDFSINTGDTLKGVFCVSDNTKSGTSGILWATALFTSDIPVLNGDTLKITYTTSF